MKSSLPTAGLNPVLSNAQKVLDEKFKEAEQSLRIVSDKGRLPRKRKKFVYKTERKAYSDLIRSVMIDLQKRQQGTSG